MAIKTVPALLAQKRDGEAVLLLTRTSADLVGYEREGSSVTTVEEALSELYEGAGGGGTGDYLPLAGGTMDGDIDMNGHEIQTVERIILASGVEIY